MATNLSTKETPPGVSLPELETEVGPPADSREAWGKPSKKAAETTYRQAASEEDAWGVFKLIVAMHEENGLQSFSYKAAWMHIQTFVRAPEAFVVVAERDGEIVGSIGACPRHFWYSDEMYVSDSWIYVAKKYRRTRIINRMKKLYEEYAAQLKMPLFTGVLTPDEPERKARLFGPKQGYKPVGYYFWKTDHV